MLGEYRPGVQTGRTEKRVFAPRDVGRRRVGILANSVQAWRMKMLLLGGTAFLGRAIATEAVARGVEVTCLARATSAPPDGVTFVAGDRDLEDGLAPVAAERWDVVVDVSRQPGQVRRALRDLSTGHVVFISTTSVYAYGDRLEQDESSLTVTALDGDVMTDMSTYGPAKVACEEAVRAAAVTATIIRPGLIGGPGDTSARSGYYPWRFAHPTGDDVLVPGDPDFPCALIDVDDLAAWTVAVADAHLPGTYNATGPTTRLAEVLELARRVAGAQAPPPCPVPVEVLRAAGVESWMGPKSLPLWIDDPADRYAATADTRAAQAHGLTTRPLEETFSRVLPYEETRVLPRRAGLSDVDERQIRSMLVQVRTRPE
jgi:nucleoside-diphosphate-sugar epimerase